MKEGISILLAELLFQIGKPVLSVYDCCRWWLYRARGQKSFPVMGHQITILPMDTGVSREIAVHRVHEPLVTRLLPETLKPGMNVVDIGSNIGYYALLEARLVGPSGKVVAIEPMRENARQLIQNVEANGYKNIVIHQLGIADRNGMEEMNVSEKSNWHTLGPVPWPTTQRQVPVSTLDVLVKRLSLKRVDLIRMDLEGYEITVIKGMLWTLRKYSPRMLVEIHPHIVGAQSILKYLQSLERFGFEVEWLVEQERDVPWRWRLLKAERPTMAELMEDSRICQDPRALTVLFSRKSRQSVLAPVETSTWATGGASRGSQIRAGGPRGSAVLL
jgi:FkbM family methyltransferase